VEDVKTQLEAALKWSEATNSGTHNSMTMQNLRDADRALGLLKPTDEEDRIHLLHKKVVAIIVDARPSSMLATISHLNLTLLEVELTLKQLGNATTEPVPAQRALAHAETIVQHSIAIWKWLGGASTLVMLMPEDVTNINAESSAVEKTTGRGKLLEFLNENVTLIDLLYNDRLAPNEEIPSPPPAQPAG